MIFNCKAREKALMKEQEVIVRRSHLYQENEIKVIKPVEKYMLKNLKSAVEITKD